MRKISLTEYYLYTTDGGLMHRYEQRVGLVVDPLILYTAGSAVNLKRVQFIELPSAFQVYSDMEGYD